MDVYQTYRGLEPEAATLLLGRAESEVEVKVKVKSGAQ